MVTIERFLQIESYLPELLFEDASWNTVLVDYEEPVVERLWRPFEDVRISLHIIRPCAVRPLYHPHPWPSVMRVHDPYEMTFGFGPGETPPPVAMRQILGPGTLYEMGHIDGWHAVNPVKVPARTVMVTGMPWDRWSPKSSKRLGPLSDQRRHELFDTFRALYPLPR